MTDTDRLIGLIIAVIALLLASFYFFVLHKDDLSGEEELRDPTLDTTEEEETE